MKVLAARYFRMRRVLNLNLSQLRGKGRVELDARPARCLKNLPCALSFRRESIWSMVRRLSKVLHDSGRCQPDFSNGNSSSAARRSGRDSWSTRLQPPEPLPRSVPIARAPRPVASAPEADWDSNTAPRAPRTARHHIAAANSG